MRYRKKGPRHAIPLSILLILLAVVLMVSTSSGTLFPQFVVSSSIDQGSGVIERPLLDYQPKLSESKPLSFSSSTDLGTDTSPSLATDGNTIIAVWESNEKSLSVDFDIVFSVSNDKGNSWSSVGSLVDSSPGSDTGARIATDRNGVWVVVWASQNPLGGTIGNDFDILYSVSVNNGESWDTPAPLNTNANTDSGHDRFPRIATDENGVWVVVWQSEDSLGGEIGIDSDILVSRSTDSGTTWSNPGFVNHASTDCSLSIDNYPQIATDKNGLWIASWKFFSDPILCPEVPTGSARLVLLSRSTDSGTTWSNPQFLNHNALAVLDSEEFHVIQAGPNGKWLGVYSSSGGNPPISHGNDPDIFITSSGDGVVWSSPKILNNNAFTDVQYDYPYTLVPNSQEGWVVGWVSKNGLDGAAGGDNDIHYSYSSDNGKSWTDPMAVNDFASTDNPSGGTTVDQDYNPVAVGRDNGWLWVWDSRHNLGGAIGTDADILTAIMILSP